MVALKTCRAAVETRVETALAIARTAFHRGIAGRDVTALASPPPTARRPRDLRRGRRPAGTVAGDDWRGAPCAGVAVRACMIETAAPRRDRKPADCPLACEGR